MSEQQIAYVQDLQALFKSLLIVDPKSRFYLATAHEFRGLLLGSR